MTASGRCQWSPESEGLVVAVLPFDPPSPDPSVGLDAGAGDGESLPEPDVPWSAVTGGASGTVAGGG